jgi:predicted glutamine amidotransferase
MCGIVGMVSSKKYGFSMPEKKIFNNLLWADTLRGQDSVGVFGVNKYGNVDYLKTKGNTAALFDSKDYAEFERNIYSKYHMVVGHNRSATKGFVSDENAHPFVEGNSILIHNGTLTNHEKLTDQTVEVDSHAILHSIIERGYEDTLKEIQGTFTLVWYNTDEKVLRIVRNDQRPLYIASVVGAWYFASEGRMLQWIIERENEKIVELKQAKAGTLYSFKLEDKNNMWFQPVELYEPKKSSVGFLPKPKDTKADDDSSSKSKEDEGKTITYGQHDFILGTRITMACQHIQTLANQTDEGYKYMFHGDWTLDPTIQIKCWATEDEEKAIELATADDTDEEALLITGELFSVITKKKKVILMLRNPKPFVATFDMQNTEIVEDEFMLTEHKCSYCDSDIEFKDLEKGVFMFTASDDFLIQCPKCFAKEHQH